MEEVRRFRLRISRPARGLQAALGDCAKECGFEYVRFHGLLHDSMGIYTEDREGRALYNWQYLDKLYDGILDAGMRPLRGDQLHA